MRLFLIAATVMFVWLLGLIAMVAFTANPVTVNRRQLRNSRFIVTATIKDLKTGRIDVLKEWKQDKQLGEVNVSGLNARVRVAGGGKPVAGGTYVMPLSTSADGFRITAVTSKEEFATIYPAEDATLKQVEEAINQ